MAPIVSTIDIDRPPEEVFAYATDPESFPEWQHDVESVHLHEGHHGKAGARFTTVRRIGRVESRQVQEITYVEPPVTWAARGVDGPLRASATITVEPRDDGAHSRVTFTLDFAGHGAGRLVPDAVGRMAAKGAPRSYRNLKELLERADHRGVT